MKSRKRQTTSIRKIYSLKFYFGICVIMLVTVYPLYFLARSGIRSYMLSSDGQLTEGIVIDEKNFTGHSPVKQQFYYSYEFSVGGEAYTGNTNNERFHVGDSVDIRYSISNPSYNEIVDD